MAGTLRWMDPYLLNGRGNPHSFQTDIYALGMVIWEIVAKKIPYGEISESHFVLVQLLLGNREEIPENIPNIIKEIIAGCWENDFTKRITLEQITNKVEEAFKVENEPIEKDNKLEEKKQNNSDQTVIEKPTEELTAIIEQSSKH